MLLSWVKTKERLPTDEHLPCLLLFLVGGHLEVPPVLFNLKVRWYPASDSYRQVFGAMQPLAWAGVPVPLLDQVGRPALTGLLVAAISRQYAAPSDTSNAANQRASDDYRESIRRDMAVLGYTWDMERNLFVVAPYHDPIRFRIISDDGELACLH